MIRRSEEIPVRDSVNARGGNGTVHFYDFMKPEDAEGHGRLFSKLILPPGASIGEHQHEGEFEAFYVVDGNPTVTDNGDVVDLKPGDMHLCPNGSFHSVANKTDKDVTMIALILNDLTV